MEKTIINFAQALRMGGMKIALSEIIDALKALELFGIENPNKFYQLLKATLLKDQSDSAIFDLAFRLYFQSTAQKVNLESEKPSCNGTNIPTKGTAGMSAMAKSFYGSIVKKDGATLMEAANEALSNLDIEATTTQELLHQLKVSLSWFMVENALEQTANEKGKKTLAELETYLRQSIERKICDQNEDGFNQLLTAENLTDKNFAALSQNQVKAMEIRIGKLGKKLASKYSYRLRPGKSGVINMRKALKETAKRGYPPSKHSYLNKVRDKPSLIILCDISGSMAIYSSFFLQLTYAMSKRFTDIKTYLFVDNIIAANFPKDSATVGEAIAATISEAYVPRTGRTNQHCTTTGVSDYGKVFHHFLQKFSETLSPKTTVIILGDAKSNWFPPNKEDLKTIANKSQKLIWLNPEPEENWDTEDSIMGLYAQYCTYALECRTITQLEQCANLII